MPVPRTFECPVCGEDVPIKAKSCPSCGACDKSGWNSEATAEDGLDLPDSNFDYEKFTEEEFGQPTKRRQKEILYRITALVLLVIVVVATVYSMLFSQ